MQIRLSTIYKIGSVVSLSELIASCDPGDWDGFKTYTHQLQVENASPKSFTLEAYDTYNEQYRDTYMKLS